MNIPRILIPTISYSCKSHSRSSKRLRSFWKGVKNIGKAVSRLSALELNAADPRPYAKVKLLDREIFGLLDSGVTMTCIGGSLAKELLEKKITCKRLHSDASIADGNKQQIVGILRTEINYKNLNELINIYIIPTLRLDLYLGIDFWQLYDLLPTDLSVSAISQDENMHRLSSVQKQNLEKVIKLFPSFAEEGLGKTTILSHNIDVGTAKR